MLSIKKPTLETRIVFDTVDGSQYYGGHGHSFETDNLVCCVFFNVAVQKIKDREELYDLILSEINSDSWDTLNGFDENIVKDIKIEEILKEHLDEIEHLMHQFNDIIDDIEEQDSDDFDTYLYGWVHVYDITNEAETPNLLNN